MRRYLSSKRLAALVLVGVMALPGLVLTAPLVTGSAGFSGSPIAFSTTQAIATNWAGYVGGGAVGSVTLVSGTWTEPAVTCGSAVAGVVFWVGIDGVYSPSTTVEQTGTFAYCAGGGAAPAYYAWWEMYPANDIQLISKITVSVGDEFKASVSWASATDKFTLKIEDVTTGVKFATTTTQASTEENSAECIAERPSQSSGLLDLPDFGSVKFSSCTATIAGVSGGIGKDKTLLEITMTSSLKSPYTVLATPSSLTGKKEFTVTWDASS